MVTSVFVASVAKGKCCRDKKCGSVMLTDMREVANHLIRVSDLNMISNVRNIAGLHPSVLRRMNSIQVFQALRVRPGISQREIGAVTGIDRSTISAIIAYFDNLGLLCRLADEKVRRRGRPSESLELRSEAGLLIGIHITPESLLYVASGLDGMPTDTLTLAPIKQSRDIDLLIERGLDRFLVQMSRRREDVSAVGVGVPGLVSSHGRLAESSNLKWHDLDLANLLSRRIDNKILVGNDSRAAGVAEKLFGKCMEVDDYIYLDSASGVGGVLFLDGKAYVGAGGFAGELGHLKVARDGRLCACGAAGCLSAYVSEPALLARIAQLGFEVRSFDDIERLAISGVKPVLLAIEEAGEVLGVALADFINIFNPRLVVLGGGLAKLSRYLLPSVERSVARNALASAHALCEIFPSELAAGPTPRGGLALALAALMEPSSSTPFPW